MHRLLTTGLLTAMALAALGAPVGAATRSLEFETCFDLDSGETAASCSASNGESADWDILVTYNADREIRAVVFQNVESGAEIAVLRDAVFEAVTADDITAAPFTHQVVDEPFADTVVILVKTGVRAVFKVGNPLEDEAGLAFDYELLAPAP